MNYYLYPSDLADAQWQEIIDLIPPPKPGGRPRRLNMRMVINAIVYVVTTGIQWRMLPREQVSEMEKCLPLFPAMAG